jgi:ABC-type polysaccharide/polyol phosphate transport system ATPase subunit
MSEIVITAEELSKSYLVGHESAQAERYNLLRDVVAREAHNFVRKASDMLHGRQIVEGDEVEEFWALKNLSFQVKRGEVLGVIGRNGAGKSTLLKILSRVTEPSRGQVRLRGRVGSILEVGTGFHPELTGRENIYLNGAILGMGRSDIKRKFDEIVAFSGVERFLDVPVKRYSSGMYVRLAFSVAAHLECDVLVIDEALAVGDYGFQQKCFRKMHEVASKEQRTVVLVSHNLGAINEMADRALLIDSGRIVVDGSVSDAVSTYLSAAQIAPIYVCPPEKGLLSPHVRRIEVLTSDANAIHRFGEPLQVKFWIRHDKPISKACFSFNVVNYHLHNVVHAWAFYPEYSFGGDPGESLLTCRFPALKLNVGRFHLRTHLTGLPGEEIYEKLNGICAFEVVRNDSILWGWQPEACAYHEQWRWDLEQVESSSLELTADGVIS